MDAALILTGILSEFLDLIDKIICYFLAHIFSKLPMFSILRKLEMGVFFFCYKQALKAESENKDFEKYLKEQAESEYSHCYYFSTLEGVGLSMNSEELFNRGKKTNDWRKVDWNGSRYQADGLSVNSLAGKMFFRGKTADSYDWANKLAFMHVLENFQYIFYQQLSPYIQSKDFFGLVAAEKNHAYQLKSYLFSLAGKWSCLFLLKWHLLKYCALFFVPIDFLILFIKYKLK
jgi:hypothetical protein